MNAMPAVLIERSPTASWIAAGNEYSVAAHSPASHTKGRPPRACLAKKFHDAWAIAAEAMRARAVGLTKDGTLGCPHDQRHRALRHQRRRPRGLAALLRGALRLALRAVGAAGVLPHAARVGTGHRRAAAPRSRRRAHDRLRVHGRRGGR